MSFIFNFRKEIFKICQTQNSISLLLLLLLPSWRLTMWRNSVSFSSKLIISNKSLYNSSTCSAANDVVRPLLHCRSEFHPYSSSPPSSSDYLKLGFQPSDGLRALSASAVDLASWASKSAHLSRHYGRCYWELSKARLRYKFS